MDYPWPRPNVRTSTVARHHADISVRYRPANPGAGRAFANFRSQRTPDRVFVNNLSGKIYPNRAQPNCEAELKLTAGVVVFRSVPENEQL